MTASELAQAEQAFREADELGRTPEPGLSQLRLVQGNVKGALASIRRAVGNESLGLPAQARLLPAAVEIAVAAGETTEAAEYADRLAALAETYDSSALHATSAFTHGQVALARGDAADPSVVLEIRTFALHTDASVTQRDDWESGRIELDKPLSSDVLKKLTDQQYVFAARLIVFHDIAFLDVRQVLQNRHQRERAPSSASATQTFW